MSIQYSQYFNTCIGENLKTMLNGHADRLSDDEILELLEVEGTLLQFIENPTQSQRLTAIQADGNAIAFVENPSWKEKLLAVQINPTTIGLIAKPSVSLQLEAVRRDPNVIQFISSPSRRVQIEAVRRDGMALQYISDIANYEVRLVALMNNGKAIEFIHEPNEQEVLIALRNNSFAAFPIKGKVKMSSRGQLEAVRLNPIVIGNIEDPNEEARMEALRFDCESSKFMMPLNSREHLAYGIGYACKFNDHIIDPDLLPAHIKRDARACKRLQEMIDSLVITGTPRERIVSLCVHISE